jgi:hypothetical protein
MGLEWMGQTITKEVYSSLLYLLQQAAELGEPVVQF